MRLTKFDTMMRQKLQKSLKGDITQHHVDV